MLSLETLTTKEFLMAAGVVVTLSVAIVTLWFLYYYQPIKTLFILCLGINAKNELVTAQAA